MPRTIPHNSVLVYQKIQRLGGILLLQLKQVSIRVITKHSDSPRVSIPLSSFVKCCLNRVQYLPLYDSSKCKCSENRILTHPCNSPARQIFNIRWLSSVTFICFVSWKRIDFFPNVFTNWNYRRILASSSAFSICDWLVHCAYLEFRVEEILPADVGFGCRLDISQLHSFTFWFYNASQPSPFTLHV